MGIEIEEIAEGLDGNDGPGAYALAGKGELKVYGVVGRRQVYKSSESADTVGPESASIE